MTFGTELKEQRRKAGLSQRDLATRIGVDFTYISKLENNRMAPPAADTIIAICKVLEILPENLLAEAGKLPNDVQRIIGESKAAQEFLRDAKQLDITDDEWLQMRQSLHKLRGDGS